MKRSEMQRMLAGLLSAMYETDKHPEKQLGRANQILLFLEEQGIKPPLTKKCPVLLTDKHVWEKEDQ